MVFLASVSDQMDLAVEHIENGSVHDACFGPMLTDNAVELVMHRLVKTKNAEGVSLWVMRHQPEIK